MNEDYLWDKSGQPDPQIQELEEILGTLGYQPKPLVIPRHLAVSRRRNYFPLLAIAATVLLALLAAGVWLQVRRGRESQPQQAHVVPTPAAVEDKTPALNGPTPVVQEDTIARNNGAKRGSAGSIHHNSRSALLLRQREREEALAAKEQLMFALRLASEKLNLAHRKTQSMTPANQIKNQHRVG